MVIQVLLIHDDDVTRDDVIHGVTCSDNPLEHWVCMCVQLDCLASTERAQCLLVYNYLVSGICVIG